MMAVAGSFCWFELATTDQEAAKQFYGALFGWSASDHRMGPEETYTTFQLNGAHVGAGYTVRANERPQGASPHWLIYIGVDDADVAAERARTLGGKVLAGPFDVADSGRMALIQDPAGVVFGIWQGRKEPGIVITGADNTVCWIDVSAPDQSRTAEFYSTLFGWQMVEGKSMHPAKPGDYYHIVNAGQMQGGVPPPAMRDPHAPPHMLMYVEVDDCAAMERKAASLGARVHVKTMKIGENGAMAVLADPQGATFALHQGN
jgi:predicted enzyme related to lactoylglutathione lyase